MLVFTSQHIQSAGWPSLTLGQKNSEGQWGGSPVASTGWSWTWHLFPLTAFDASWTWSVCHSVTARRDTPLPLQLHRDTDWGEWQQLSHWLIRRACTWGMCKLNAGSNLCNKQWEAEGKLFSGYLPQTKKQPRSCRICQLDTSTAGPWALRVSCVSSAMTLKNCQNEQAHPEIPPFWLKAGQW